MKTYDLIGAPLRYAVAKAVGWKLERIENGDWKDGEPHWWMAINEARVTSRRNGLVGYIKPGESGITSGYDYCPDVDWRITGPLIEKYQLSVTSPKSSVHRYGGPKAGWGESGCWGACTWTPGHDGRRDSQHHETSLLVAVCRTIVASVLGDVVKVPAELVEVKP